MCQRWWQVCRGRWRSSRSAPRGRRRWWSTWGSPRPDPLWDSEPGGTSSFFSLCYFFSAFLFVFVFLCFLLLFFSHFFRSWFLSAGSRAKKKWRRSFHSRDSGSETFSPCFLVCALCIYFETCKLYPLSVWIGGGPAQPVCSHSFGPLLWVKWPDRKAGCFQLPAQPRVGFRGGSAVPPCCGVCPGSVQSARFHAAKQLQLLCASDLNIERMLTCICPVFHSSEVLQRMGASAGPQSTASA